MLRDVLVQHSKSKNKDEEVNTSKNKGKQKNKGKGKTHKASTPVRVSAFFNSRRRLRPRLFSVDAPPTEF
jgi:hypothetical protein